MGMAASQARLLSITTRLSDNELRAQVINNSKMRLASESSRVSENYVSALNNSTMMLTNTDASGNSQYQALNFNNLTQYSATNNQFGLVNASGNLLVSEREAALYKKAVANDKDNSLNEFLKLHGLEYKSTYFDSLKAHEKGGVIPGFDMTTDQLKQLYFGVDAANSFDGKAHYSYAQGLTSTEYLQYDTLINTYNSTKSVFQQTSKQFLKTNMMDKLTDNGGKTYKDLRTEISGITDETPLGTIESYITRFKNIIENAANTGKIIDGINSDYYVNLHEQIEAYENGSLGYKTEWGDAAHNTLMVYSPSGGIGGTQVETYIKISKTGNTDQPYKAAYYDAEGNEIPLTNDDTTQETITYNKNNIIFTSVDKETGVTYTETYTVPNDWGSGAAPNQVSVTEVTTPDDTSAEEKLDKAKSFLNQLTSYFSSTFYKNADVYKCKDSWEDEMKSVAATFEDAAQDLSEFIFGNKGNQNTWLKLDDIDYIKEKGYLAKMQPILDIVTIENLFDTYGEPNDSWAYIDENKTGNADAEAKWYTNLFNRMQEGYKVLENGLASSSEWIQYALESGLVTMEQVDSKSNWTSTMYANVSTITEKTNSNQTTIAEAEYNREMNRIQSKDKQYDMELKNIDTEHNSLQTEYDSIKSVIDKNIERNLKLYSA